MLRVLASAVRHRYLLGQLVRQLIIVQYRQSVLGLGWAVLQPAIYTGIFLVLRSVVPIPSDGIPYPLFALAGMTGWGTFATAVTVGSASIVLNAAIIRKVYFPRELFPAAAVLTRALDFGVGLVMLAAMMAYYRAPVTWHILWVPFLFACQTLFSLAISLVAAALGAFKRDFVLGMPFLLQFGTFVSPVIYPLSAVPEAYRALYLLNPMAGLIESYRRVLLRGLPPEPVVIASSILSTLVLLELSCAVFKRLEMKFADVI